jgi:glutamine amidotransferase
MHLLFSGSDEGPGPGLGFLPGRIVALPATPRSHHIGWATPTWATSAPPFARAPGHRFAFAHGFACPADHPATAATLAVQGRDWAMAVHAGNLIGVQFHPEKSLDAGARLCADFARWCGHDLIDLPWDA